MQARSGVSSIHDKHGTFHQSLEFRGSVGYGYMDISYHVSRISMCKDCLTYFEHHPPRCPRTFSYVYSAKICRMRDDGEDFTLKTDWGAIIVFGFEGFTAGLSNGMTGERSKWA